MDSQAHKRPVHGGRKRQVQAIVFAMAMLASKAAAGETLVPWAGKSQSGDVPRKHVEKITAAETGAHTYTVIQGGAMDGQNCRSPLGVGMNREQVCEQTWES